MFSSIKKYGIVPLVKVETEEDAIAVAQALAQGGLPIMEIAFRSFAHCKAMRRISKEMPDFIVGAGNILNKDQLDRAVDASAKFAFSPGTVPETISEAAKRKIMYAPGVCTPSDIERGLLAGAADFQFFPAEQSGGVDMLCAIAEPFRHLGIEFFAKGGITLEKIERYLKIPYVAGVSAEWIASADLISAKNWDAVKANAIKASEAASRIRSA